jgi:aminoglycoside phosphotransferase family enzyme/predicted kinase
MRPREEAHVIVEDQTEIIDFLAQPEAYAPIQSEPTAGAAVEPGGVEQVQRIDTHISHVFLAGAHAYKLKRAVRLPYLDFSSEGLRRRWCEREVEINRRTAPMLYQGCVPVVRSEDGGLAIGGEGQAVDWLVVMTRFDAEAVFDRLAAAGRLDRFAVEILADVVARFHASAEPRPDHGGAAALARVIAGNRQSFAECAAGSVDREAVARLDAKTVSELERVAPLLERRSRDGFVRRCHGDLHLRNIVAWQGLPVLFDAIEFSDELAEIDVLYDLAFLVMDVGERCGRHLACLLLNRYLDATGDTAGLAAMPLFLAIRAAIRSHVEAAAGGGGERAAAASARYFAEAEACLTPRPPRLIAVGGLSGSGKSRLARDLAPFVGLAPGARIVRTDTTRKRLAGVGFNTRLAPALYGEAMTRKTYEAVYAEVRTALAAGYAVIADAVFGKPEERAAIARVATEAGVPFQALWLQAPPPVLEERVTRRRMNASDATAEVVRLQLSYDLGPIDWPRQDTQAAADVVLAEACDRLGLRNSAVG